MNVFRPKRKRNGKSVIVSPYYRGRYRLAGEMNWTEIALHISDKEAALQKLKKIVSEREREAAGVGVPKALKDAASQNLDKHLESYIAGMQGARCGEGHVYRTEKRLGKLFRECGWTRLRDITADSFEVWRTKNIGKSAKTVNEYLGAARTFIKGMVQKGRLDIDPLKSVKKINCKGKATRERRALTDAEMRRLLAVAGPRQVVYLTAVQTGIRRGELERLVWGDLILDGHLRQVRVRASSAKSGKLRIIPLCGELAAVLKSIRPVAADCDDRIFDKVPDMDQYRADLKAAGIDFSTEQGRADFHALRHTFITNLNCAGVAPRAAMELAGHSQMNLTMNVYTDVNLLPLAAAVLKLPQFCSTLPQILPHGTGAGGHLLSKADMVLQGADTYNEPENVGERRELAEVGAGWQKNELAPQVGLEPTT